MGKMRVLLLITVIALGGCKSRSEGWTKCPRGFDVPGGPYVNGGRWKLDGNTYHEEVAYYRISENGRVLEWRQEGFTGGSKTFENQGHYMLKAGQSVGCVDWGPWDD